MMIAPPTKLTDAERNHLDHYYWEGAQMQPGSATEWNIACGILPHELIPLAKLRAEETHREKREYPFEPTEPWAPPAQNADAFRTRINVIAEAQGGHQHRNIEAKWDQDSPQSR